MAELARRSRRPLQERLAEAAERLRAWVEFPEVVVETRPRWAAAIPTLALVFVAARLLAIAAAIVGEALRPEPPAWLLTTTQPILRSLTSWDVVHYVSIATNGYTTQPMLADRPFPEYVFFPALPALMAALHGVTGLSMPIAALLISNVAFALALAVVYALGTRYVGHDRALVAAAFVALAPGAAAFAMGYSDGLFLLASAGAFLALETRRDGIAAFAYALATLTRLPGVALGLPLLLLLVARDGIRPTRRWLVLAAGPLALAAFYGYLWMLTGDPLANLHGQAAWSEQSLPAGLTPVFVVAAIVLFGGMVALLVASAVLTVRARRTEVPPVYVVYAGVGLAIVLASLRLVSLPRYVAVLFPIAWAAAATRRWRVLLSISAVLYVVFAAASFGPGPAP